MVSGVTAGDENKVFRSKIEEARLRLLFLFPPKIQEVLNPRRGGPGGT